MTSQEAIRCKIMTVHGHSTRRKRSPLSAKVGDYLPSKWNVSRVDFSVERGHDATCLSKNVKERLEVRLLFLAPTRWYRPLNRQGCGRRRRWRMGTKFVGVNRDAFPDDM